MMPAVVLRRLSSVRIRQRTGKACGCLSQPGPFFSPLFRRSSRCHGAAQHDKGTHSDGNGNADEEQVGAEVNVHQAGVVAELVVQAPGQGAAQSEGQGQAGKGDGRGDPPVANEEAHVGLEADEEEVEHEAEVGDEGQVGQGVLGEDGVAEVGDAAHDRGAEDDAANDLCDDAGLADLLEGPVKKVAEDEDEAGLDDEEGQGVLGVVAGGVGALDDAALGGGALAVFELCAGHCEVVMPVVLFCGLDLSLAGVPGGEGIVTGVVLTLSSRPGAGVV